MNKKALKRWLPPILIALLIGVAWASGLMDMVNLETVKARREELLAMVSARPVTSIAGFTALYAVTVALSLPIAAVLSLLGGFLFGRWMGTLVIVIAATAGATVIFLIARSALGDTLRDKAGRLYNRIADNMERNAVGYMLFMRLVPVFPFFLVNIVPALFNVRLLPYVLTTFFGIIPGTFVYANLGRELGTIETLRDLASPQTLIAFTLLGLFALIPTLYRQIKGRKKVAAAFLAIMLATAQPAQAGESYNRFLNLYDGLLQTHVRPAEKDGIAYNGVDYNSWAADPRHKDALNLLLAENPDSHTGDEQMAFWINAYNFLTLELIIREGERENIKNLGGLFTSPWTRYSWKLAGRDYTLDHIEHRMLRPMGDARIHFAINCASVSCPDLRRESYKADKLHQQMDEQVALTLVNEGKGLRAENGTVYVSQIFDWFAADFKNGNVKDWLLDYTALELPFTIEFMDYDWSLNKVN